MTEIHGLSFAGRTQLWGREALRVKRLAKFSGEEINPREPERGKWISGDEMMLRHSDETIRWEMAKRHARVMPLGSRVPPRID